MFKTSFSNFRSRHWIIECESKVAAIRSKLRGRVLRSIESSIPSLLLSNKVFSHELNADASSPFNSSILRMTAAESRISLVSILSPVENFEPPSCKMSV